MSTSGARDDGGQALIVVALSMAVLMGALALSVDWGYALLSRRAAQTDADAVALGTGRYLVSSYTGGASPFDVSQEDVWCEAKRQQDLNLGSAPTTRTQTLSLSFYAADGTVLDTISSANCAAPGNTDVPATTAALRAQAGMTQASLFGGMLRQPIQVSASSRVELSGSAGITPLRLPQPEIPGAGLSGATTTPNVALWPLVKHFDASDYSGRLPCGQYCASTSRRFTLFPDAPRFGSFSGLVTYAHGSPRDGGVHQLITESDYTGTGTGHHGHVSFGPVASAPGTCGGNPWDTMGQASLALAMSCDIPNWFRNGFRGSLGLSTNWSGPSWASFESATEMPDALPSNRASCDEAPSYFTMPSCASSALTGDWVETVAGDMTPLMATQMRAFIQAYGRAAPNGRGTAVVVHIFLWDCAENFQGSQPPGDRWSHLGALGNDEDQDGCRISRRDTRTRSVDRVHLVSVLPVTVYLSDVITSGSNVTVYAYWGDVFGDAGSCAATVPPAGCGLNPLINSAYLVPDE